MKLPKELNHPIIWLINIQNIDDNEYFEWSAVTYLNAAYRNPAKITKTDNKFTKNLDFKGLKHPVKSETLTKSKKNP